MKRILALVLTLALLLSGTAWGEELERPAAGEAQAAEQTTDGQGAAPLAASSTSGTWGTNLTWRFDRSTGTLTISGRGEMKKATDRNNTYPWSEMRDTATRIVIEEGVTSIADRAFERFWRVTSVSLPSTLESIGIYAFEFNSTLESISIPASVTRIEEGAFRWCYKVKTITFSEGLTEIGDSAFTGLGGKTAGIESLNLPRSLRSIGRGAFSDVRWKRGYNLVLPYGLKTIGNGAFGSFYVTYPMSTILIPSSVTKMYGKDNDDFSEATLLCEAGSYAEKYAKRYNIRYRIVAAKPHPTKLTLSRTGTVLMTAGETLTLSASAAPADAVYSLSWKSSNTRVATVENGVVRALGEGSARVTATTDNGKSAYVTVKVVDPYKPTGITLSESGTVTLNMGSMLRLGYSLQPASAQSDVTWKSSNTRVATVANGVVTPLKEGTVTITVTTAKENKRASVKVKVVDPYKPTGIVLNQSGTVTLDTDSTLRLGYSLQPSSAQSDVTWKSSNTRVATVENGVVRPVKEGTVTITVTTAKENKRASVKVKVVDPYKPTGITLSESGTVTLNMGSTLLLGYSLQPSSAQSDVTWKSSNTRVATVANYVDKKVDVTFLVSSTGEVMVASSVVTPLKEGTVTITATTAKENKRASVKVKVVDPYKPTGIVLNQSGTVTLNMGSTLRLGYSLQPASAQSDVTWKSSNTRVATVENGVVRPVKEGTVTITVTTAEENKRASVKVKVVDPYKPTGITLSQSGTVTLNMGSTLRLGHSLQPASAQSDVTWKSSNTRVATVANGVVTPLKEGTVTITVTTAKENKRASVKVKVVDSYTPQPSNRIDLTEYMASNVHAFGKKFKLKGGSIEYSPAYIPYINYSYISRDGDQFLQGGCGGSSVPVQEWDIYLKKEMIDGIACLNISDYQVLGGIYCTMTQSEAKQFMKKRGWRQTISDYDNGVFRYIYKDSYGNFLAIYGRNDRVTQYSFSLGYEVCRKIAKGTYKYSDIQRMFKY